MPVDPASTGTAPLTAARFARILEAYGAEPRRWPEAERAAALAFLDARPELAKPMLEEARALDALLDAAGSGAADETPSAPARPVRTPVGAR